MNVHFGQPIPSWHLPQDKRDKLLAVADGLVRDSEQGVVQCKAVARCIGKLISATRAVPLAKLLFRELNWPIYEKGSPDWHGSLSLSPAAIKDLKWILRCFRPFNLRGSPILVSSMVEKVDCVLIQDAGPRAVGFAVHEPSDLAAASADHLPLGDSSMLVGWGRHATDTDLEIGRGRRAKGADSNPVLADPSC